MARLAVVAILTVLLPSAVTGQAAPSAPPAVDTAGHATAAPAGSPARPATLVYGNRTITELRASILNRTPEERVAAAVSQLDAIVGGGQPGQVTAQQIHGATVIAVGAHPLFVLLPGDVDELTGETLAQKTADTVQRLQVAINEEVELRTPALLLRGIVEAAGITLILIAIVWAIARGRRAALARAIAITESRLQRFTTGDRQLLHASRAIELIRFFVTAIALVAGGVMVYAWAGFVLRRFPYTRPWGESLREALLTRLAAVGLAVAEFAPNLLTIALVVVLTRFISRLTSLLFVAVEQGRLTLPLVYPETAQPTRRLVNVFLWLFALIVSYPYLPGSDSEAFKGVSVFVGLVISLGSSGIVNQVMSGLTITYSRALRVGDYVRIGDVEGTVVFVGSLSTKIRTPRREEITMPNAVVVANITTNYSRYTDADSVCIPATITIGYDVPWRQVRAMLLMAAERTASVKREPPPVVRQTALHDSYVEYTLLVSPELPHLRAAVLDALYANILDVFNEFGVQITSPNYEGDPEMPKIVPRARWYAAPAASPAGNSDEAPLRVP